MRNPRYKSTPLYRHALTSACSVSLAVLLSACGSGNTDTATDSPTASGSSSISAAQLASDDTTSLSVAQAAAAGLVPVETVETSTSTDSDADSGVGEAIEASQQSGNQPELAEANEADTNEVEANEADADSFPENGGEGSVTPIPVTDETESETVEPAPVPVEAQPVVAEPTTDAEEQPAVEAEPTNMVDVDSNTPEQTPDAGEANEADEPSETTFTATNTDGFVGEVLDDGAIKVSWLEDPTARGYNVYRQAEYIATVFTEEYIDTDTFDESYYYEIQAFDFDENYNYVARGLTVDVTGTGRVNPDSPTPNENILDGYELVFSDEFNGTELDSSKWVTQYLWGDALVINSEEQHYVDIQNKPDFGYNPFTFDGESITINSIETPDDLAEKAYGQKYLSGMFTSYDSFKFTYGYVEARVQLPFGQGLWPAFWLLNAYYVDDKPEIDIMEFIGDNQDVVYHTYHYHDSDGTLRSTESAPSSGVDFTNGWHTFGVEWLPGVLIFYVNGIEKHRVVDAKVSQQEMYIIANTALGGWWPGSPDSTTNFPAQYKIDYIRAYQKAGGVPQSDPTEGLESKLLQWDDVPGASPSHLPPFELWPEGYPERATN